MTPNTPQPHKGDSADAMWQKLQHRNKRKERMQGLLIGIAALIALVVILVGLAIVIY